MPISIVCRCGARYRVKNEHGGRKTKCTACGESIEIPAPEPILEAVPGDISAILSEINTSVPPLQAERAPIPRKRGVWFFVLLAVYLVALATAGSVAFRVFRGSLETNHRGDGYKALERKEFASAEMHYKAAIADDEKAQKFSDLAIDVEGLAKTYFAQERYPEALEQYMRCSIVYDEVLEGAKAGSSFHLMSGEALKGQADTLICLGRFDEAATCLERSIAMLETVYGRHLPPDEDLFLAKVLMRTRRYSDADNAIKRAMGRAIESSGGQSFAFAKCLEVRADLYRTSGLGGGYEADMWLRSAKAIREGLEAKRKALYGK